MVLNVVGSSPTFHPEHLKRGKQNCFPLFLRLFALIPPGITKQFAQVTSGPRRGPTFNNRWWNDRRSWNLRTTKWRELSSPKGANNIHSCSCSPPSGTIRECIRYPQVPFPSVIPPAVIHIRPLRGRQDSTCETSVNENQDALNSLPAHPDSKIYVTSSPSVPC